MSRGRRRAWSVAALTALLVAVTAAPAEPAGFRRVNLDADPALEMLVVRAVRHDVIILRQIVLLDRCDGEVRRFRLSTFHDNLEFLRVVEADGYTERPEIYFALRSGASGRAGIAKIIRLGGRGERGCGEPVALFRYATTNPHLEPPANLDVVNFYTRFGNYRDQFRGKEVRLFEALGVVGCCPTKQRVSGYHFAPRRDRYVRHVTRVADV